MHMLHFLEIFSRRRKPVVADLSAKFLTLPAVLLSAGARLEAGREYAFWTNVPDMVVPCRTVTIASGEPLVRYDGEQECMLIGIPADREIRANEVPVPIEMALSALRRRVSKGEVFPRFFWVVREQKTDFMSMGLYDEANFELIMRFFGARLRKGGLFSAANDGGTASHAKAPNEKRAGKLQSTSSERAHYVFASGRSIDYQIEYRRSRKRSALVMQRGELFVRHPVRASLRTPTESFLEANETWIFANMEKQRRRCESHRAEFDFRDGGGVYFRGERARLRLGASRAGVRRLESDEGFGWEVSLATAVYADEASVRAELCALYRREAKRVLDERFHAVVPLARIKPKSTWQISRGTRTLGTCSRGGDIRLSWRLVLMPDALIDYVAAHELAHLVEFNHSRQFWSELERMMPDAKKRRQALRDFNAMLVDAI